MTAVQSCIIHLIQNTFRLASKRDRDALKRDVATIYIAPNATAARVALDELTERWGNEVRGDRPVVGKRLNGVHPGPRLLRRDPQGHLFDERDRVVERATAGP
jgi:putative transposase